MLNFSDEIAVAVEVDEHEQRTVEWLRTWIAIFREREQAQHSGDLAA